MPFIVDDTDGEKKTKIMNKWNSHTFSIFTFWWCWWRGVADGGNQLFQTKLAVGTHGDYKRLAHTHRHIWGPWLTGLPAGSSWGHSVTFPKDVRLHFARPPRPPGLHTTGQTPASQSKVSAIADIPAPAARECCLLWESSRKSSSRPLRALAHHSTELSGPAKWLRQKSYMLPCIRVPC